VIDAFQGSEREDPVGFKTQLHILHSMLHNSIIEGTQFYESYNNVIQHQLPYVAGHTLSNCRIPPYAPNEGPAGPRTCTS
jgi:hypothetical protein